MCCLVLISPGAGQTAAGEEPVSARVDGPSTCWVPVLQVWVSGAGEGPGLPGTHKLWPLGPRGRGGQAARVFWRMLGCLWPTSPLTCEQPSSPSKNLKHRFKGLQTQPSILDAADTCSATRGGQRSTGSWPASGSGDANKAGASPFLTGTEHGSPGGLLCENSNESAKHTLP